MLDAELESLQGQWLGSYEAVTGEEKSSGTLLINLDAGAGYVGTAVVHEDNPESGIGGVYAITLERRGATVTGAANLVFLTDVQTNQLQPAPPGEINIGGRTLSRNITVAGSIQATKDDALRFILQWNSNLPSVGAASAVRFGNQLPSTIRQETVDWETFKRRVPVGPPGRLFRGQSDDRRLRTKFHRSGRADILKFAFQDMADIRRAVSGQLSFLFDVSNPEHHTALMALAQHHGYPTPLLDWTMSPYVAAYFAVKDVLKRPQKSRPRIFQLDSTVLTRYSRPASDIASPLPTITVVTPIPLHNPRIVPQQSVVTFTNIEDVERWLQQLERTNTVQCIMAFDLEDDHARVLAELRLMGIHAGSMFPGLDGTCQSVAEKNFLREPEPVKASDRTETERSPT